MKITLVLLFVVGLLAGTDAANGEYLKKCREKLSNKKAELNAEKDKCNEEKNSLIEECDYQKSQLRDQHEEDMQSLLEEKEEKNSLIEECEDGKDQVRDRYEEQKQSLLEEIEKKNSLIEKCDDEKDQVRDQCEEGIQSLLEEKAKLKADKDVCDEEKNSLREKCEDEKNHLRDGYEEDIQSLQEKKEGLMGQIAELTKSAGSHFTSQNCGTSNRVYPDNGKFLLNTEGGVWNTDGWCTVLECGQTDASDNSYTLSVSLFADNEEECHLGLAYNVQDIDNFDFIYYRPHSDTRCFQAGYVVDGRTTFDVRGACPEQPEFRTWFDVKVVVKPGKANAELYLNGRLTTEAQSMHYPKTAKGGIILANGFENRAHFKDLELY